MLLSPEWLWRGFCLEFVLEPKWLQKPKLPLKSPPHKAFLGDQVTLRQFGGGWTPPLSHRAPLQQFRPFVEEGLVVVAATVGRA